MAQFQQTRELYSGLIRLHVLHHACEGPIFGLGMIEELARHGYRLSPGTLYPLLDGMEKKGLLRSSRQQVAGRIRRVYRATPAGHKALRAAKHHVQELFGELFENEPIPLPGIHDSDSRRRKARARRSSLPTG